MIESLSEEGVGNTLNPVGSGCGEAVAVACAAEGSPVEEQAVRVINTIAKMLDNFFIEALEINLILIRINSLSRFHKSDLVKKSEWNFPLASSSELMK